LINGIQAKIDETPLPLTVAVAGGTGSGTEMTKAVVRRCEEPFVSQPAGHLCPGKTTFAQAIYRALGEQHVTYITHDSYYKDLGHLPVEARAKQNFDHPDALDTALLVQHIRALKYGSSDALCLDAQ
jgi:pantothenate kinase-related protein Tda10